MTATISALPAPKRTECIANSETSRSNGRFPFYSDSASAFALKELQNALRADIRCLLAPMAHVAALMQQLPELGGLRATAVRATCGLSGHTPTNAFGAVEWCMCVQRVNWS